METLQRKQHIFRFLKSNFHDKCRNECFVYKYSLLYLSAEVIEICPLIIQDIQTNAISFAQAEETYPLKFKINQVLVQVTNHGITETLSPKEKVQFLKTDMKLLPNTPWCSYQIKTINTTAQTINFYLSENEFATFVARAI